MFKDHETSEKRKKKKTHVTKHFSLGLSDLSSVVLNRMQIVVLVFKEVAYSNHF